MQSCGYNVSTGNFDMKLKLVCVGNSKGIRIPKPLIEQCGFGETVEVSVKDGCMVIAAERKPREGWEAAFRSAGQSPDDEILLAGAIPNEFDRDEWQW